MAGRLTEAEASAMRAYAKAMVEYIPPCPWNPFPRNSPWGRLIDEKYRLNEKRRRASRATLKGESDG